MKTFKTAALAATFALVLGGAAFADPAATANTADPGSAPFASATGGPVHFSYDAAARANTADPGSAPMARDAAPVRGPLDAAGKADTRDPDSVPVTTGQR